MENRRSVLMASLMGVLGTLIYFGGAMIETWLSTNQLPAWAIFGTMGSSVVTYLYLVRMAVPLLMVTTALGAGYYIGRRINVIREYRRLIRTFAAGITVGVSLVWLVISRSMLTTIGDAPASVPQSQATQMLIRDIVYPVLSLFTSIAQVGLIVMVGMFAGAALARARIDTGTPTHPTEADNTSMNRPSEDTPSGRRTQSAK